MLNSAGELVHSVFDGVTSLLFPFRCSGCDRLDVKGFCQDCYNALEWVNPGQCCAKCSEISSTDAESGSWLCRRCRKVKPSYDRAVSSLRYSGPLARAIVLWKYEDNSYLSDYFADLLALWVTDRAPSWFESVDAIVPTPMHSVTLKKRGFSPPEALARNISLKFALNYMPRVLFKIRQTPPQARLSMDERFTNVEGCMMVFDESLVSGRTILVIDDVMTTGATMSECARALKEAGAKKVFGLTLARQSGSKRKK